MNPNNLQLLADNLEDIIESIVSPGLLGRLTEKQREYLTGLCFQWTQGKDVTDTIKSILESGKINNKKYYFKQL